MHQNKKTDHIPVLLNEVLEYLDPRPGQTYIDTTAGYGGHAEAVLAKTNASAVLIDRDKNAIDYLGSKFKAADVHIVQSDYLSASMALKEKGQSFDLILADLGVSSPHLNMASRGFSFKPGPLDMRMDQDQALTAKDIVNTYSEKQLTDLLKRYGEEPQAHRIAAAIVRSRPIQTTDELTSIVADVKKGRTKIHPATQTFQALRIAVNDELSQLEQALPIWIDLLAPDGHIVVISFHSLEDRIVKQVFADAGGKGYDARLRLLTKSPITASRQELAFNPRARSAKLRAAVKIKT